MPAFANRDLITRSLQAFGLGHMAQAVVASSRSCLRFARVQELDSDSLLTSKIGGDPLLPPGMDWPLRPPVPDADEWIARLDKAHQAALDMRTGDPLSFLPDSVRETMSQEDLDALASATSAMGAPDQLEALERAHQANRSALLRPMPLAFHGQINLGELSGLDGFDLALPRRGMLGFFSDVTHWQSPPKVVYFNGDITTGSRHDTPQALIDYFDAQGFAGMTPWNEADKCERLDPVSAWSVPHHWNQVVGAHPSFDEWTWEAQDILLLSDNRPTADGTWPDRMDFGDQLGGFPVPVQDHPEYDMEPGPRKTIEPGKSPWRMLFTSGGECLPGTRLYPGGDGQFYWMIHESALERADFSDVRLPYQQT